MFSCNLDYICIILLFYTDILLDDFLVAENSPCQPEVNSPVLTSERSTPITSPKINHSNRNSQAISSLDGGPETPSSGGGLRYFVIPSHSNPDSV